MLASGRAHADAERWSDAYEAYTEATQTQPKYFESNEVGWFGQGIAHPLLAIAHHKSGRAEDALRSFEQSQALLDRILNDSVSKFRGSPAIPWVDWIEFLINHREASIVVKGHTPVIDPRLRQMEVFAETSVVD